MFKEILQDLVHRTDGGVAGLLMASDGIAIDQYSSGDGSFDIESVGMEYSVVLKGVQRAAEMLDAGDAQPAPAHPRHALVIPNRDAALPLLHIDDHYDHQLDQGETLMLA